MISAGQVITLIVVLAIGYTAIGVYIYRTRK